MSDPLIRSLAELPMSAPDHARSERVRMECHGRLAQRSAAGSGLRTSARLRTIVPIWQSLITALGFVYLAVVIIQALHVY